MTHRRHLLSLFILLLAAAGATFSLAPVSAQAQSTAAEQQAPLPSGPVRLRQPQQASGGAQGAQAVQQPSGRGTGARVSPLADDPADAAPTDAELERLGPDRYRPGEFELYVQRLLNNRNIRRFGADLVLDTPPDPRAPVPPEPDPQVPEDYRVGPGDELLLSMWGSVDADLRLRVDRAGRLNIPRIGSVTVAGLKLPEVAAAVERQGRKTFRTFELSVSITELRQIRVFVTGFAQRPGAYTVGSLTTLSSVLLSRAGGPAAAGSFRQIELRREGRLHARLDLYDLMLFGKRDADHGLQADDVIHVGPIGRQVAVVGSVNKPAIFELAQGESVSDVIQMAGGLNSVADRTRVAVERLSERHARRVQELRLPDEARTSLDSGDVLRVFSAIDMSGPLERQNKSVRVEGEVNRPGTYILPPGSSLADALKAAGGLTSAAYLFGAEFYRETVRQTQQVNYDRAVRDLELELSRRVNGLVPRPSGEDAATQLQQQRATDFFLARLREVRPTGRVVMQLTPDARELPNLALEDSDRLVIPPRPTTVGVYGSVFNTGNYLYGDGKLVNDYIRLAGSPTRGADRRSVFVVRANGSVMSAQQQAAGWLVTSSFKVEEQPALPGDSIFVPEEANKIPFQQSAKDWTQILYQLGVGLASVISVSR